MNIDKLLFFDIETVSKHRSFLDMPKDEKTIWLSCVDVFKKRIINEEAFDLSWEVDGDMYNEELYRQTSPLFPEFGMVCCVSMAFVGKEGVVRYESFCGNNEKDILTDTRKIFDKVYKLGFSLCGQSIKNFDIPYLGKRYLINGLKPPNLLPTHDTKPWDLKVVDIKDVWSFGDRWGLSSLNVISTCLGVSPNINNRVSGSDIHDLFWGGDYKTIKTHCEEDVKSPIDIIQKINNLK